MVASQGKTSLLITGMRDNASREVVLDALQSVDGVREVHVNLYRASATVIHEPACAPAALAAAVARAGFGASVAPAAPDGKGGAGRGPEPPRETRR